MSVMEDVLINAKTAVDSFGKKAGEVFDRSKLRLAAVDIKAELSKKYRMLGKVCYEANRTGKNYDKSIKQLQDQINELNNQLTRIKETLAAAEKKIKCSACGTINAKGSVFCSKCGAKLSAVSDSGDDYTQEELLDYAKD